MEKQQYLNVVYDNISHIAGVDEIAEFDHYHMAVEIAGVMIMLVTKMMMTVMKTWSQKLQKFNSKMNISIPQLHKMK